MGTSTSSEVETSHEPAAAPEGPAAPAAPAGPAGPAGRPLRADARRNREKLVTVARAAFTASGDAVALERVARDAGVGIGTLYRHFPTREALVEAVYAAELDDVVTSAAQLLGELLPEAALRAWMGRYAAFASAKRGMIDTLRAGWASGRITTSATRERMTDAVGAILAAGAADGTLRGDVEAGDVISLLLGVSVAMGPDPDHERTVRLLDLVADGLRPTRG